MTAVYSHLDLDAEDTLPEHDVPDGVVNEVLCGLAGVDHETVGELHRLSTGSTELSRDNDLTTLRARLHDEPEDTIASPGSNKTRIKIKLQVHAPTDSKTTEELVAQALALSDGRETTVLDLLGVELERVFGELETLLHEGSKLTDAATLLTQNLLSVGGTDDDLREGEHPPAP